MNIFVSQSHKFIEPPAFLTAGATASTFMFWGLHLSDIGVIVSSLASLCGVGLQFYVVIRRVRAEKRQQETRQDGYEDVG